MGSCQEDDLEIISGEDTNQEILDNQHQEFQRMPESVQDFTIQNDNLQPRNSEAEITDESENCRICPDKIPGQISISLGSVTEENCQELIDEAVRIAKFLSTQSLELRCPNRDFVASKFRPEINTYEGRCHLSLVGITPRGFNWKEIRCESLCFSTPVPDNKFCYVDYGCHPVINQGMEACIHPGSWRNLITKGSGELLCTH